MMRLAGVVSVFAASQASAGWDSVVTIVGPETLRPGETVTLEVWAEITHPAFVPGQSAIAGFGFDLAPGPRGRSVRGDRECAV